jgi:hypothetical protein
MVTLIMLCANPYETIADGMAMAAAAHKAEYNSLTEARILLSYGLTYPENLMKKYDKEKACCDSRVVLDDHLVILCGVQGDVQQRCQGHLFKLSRGGLKDGTECN